MRPMSLLPAFAALLFALLTSPACSRDGTPGLAAGSGNDQAAAAGPPAVGPPEATGPSARDSSSPPDIPVDQLHADFDQLYAQLKASHYDLFARRSRAEYDALFKQMRAALDAPLPRHEAQLRFTRFVAYGRVAHARIDLPFDRWAQHRQAGGRALPLFLRVQDDKVFVLRDLGGSDAVSPGDQLLAVDGTPALAWLQRLGALVSADNDYMLFAQMEGMLPLLGWLALGDVDGVELTLAGGSGAPRKTWFPATTRAAASAIEAEEAVAGGTDMQARELRLPGQGIAYLRPGPFYDNRPEASTPWDRSAFRGFIDQAFADILAARCTDLLLDLRDNPGGDNSFSDLMLAWIADQPFHFSPGFDIRVSEATVASNRARLQGEAADAGGASADLARLYEGKPHGSRVTYAVPLVPPRERPRFEGRVHVLVNRHTYSNAVSVAAIVQDYGFGRVLGEETSDLASTYGAMEQFTLAHTGLAVGYPKARILRPSGNADARGVVPDVVLPRPVVESGGDSVLARALEEVAGSRR